MSRWTEIEREDIEADGEDLNVLIGLDEFGNNYVTIKIKDILDALGELTKGKELGVK